MCFKASTYIDTDQGDAYHSSQEVLGFDPKLDHCLHGFHKRRILTDAYNQTGIAPAAAQVGDTIGVIFTAVRLRMIRPLSDGQWSLISGNCYTTEIYEGDTRTSTETAARELFAERGMVSGSVEQFELVQMDTRRSNRKCCLLVLFFAAGKWCRLAFLPGRYIT